MLQKAEQCARTELQLEKENLANEIVNEFASANKYYGQLENEIATILQSGQVQRTGNMRADLQAAYDLARQTSREVIAERARHASRSVHGGPSPGRAAPHTRGSGNYNDDLYGDVTAAVRARSI